METSQDEHHGFWQALNTEEAENCNFYSCDDGEIQFYSRIVHDILDSADGPNLDSMQTLIDQPSLSIPPAYPVMVKAVVFYLCDRHRIKHLPLLMKHHTPRLRHVLVRHHSMVVHRLVQLMRNIQLSVMTVCDMIAILSALRRYRCIRFSGARMITEAASLCQRHPEAEELLIWILQRYRMQGDTLEAQAMYVSLVSCTKIATHYVQDTLATCDKNKLAEHFVERAVGMFTKEQLLTTNDEERRNIWAKVWNIEAPESILIGKIVAISRELCPMKAFTNEMKSSLEEDSYQEDCQQANRIDGYLALSGFGFQSYYGRLSSASGTAICNQLAADVSRMTLNVDGPSHKNNHMKVIRRIYSNYLQEQDVVATFDLFLCRRAPMDVTEHDDFLDWIRTASLDAKTKINLALLALKHNAFKPTFQKVFDLLEKIIDFRTVELAIDVSIAYIEKNSFFKCYFSIYTYDKKQDQQYRKLRNRISRLCRVGMNACKSLYELCIMTVRCNITHALYVDAIDSMTTSGQIPQTAGNSLLLEDCKLADDTWNFLM